MIKITEDRIELHYETLSHQDDCLSRSIAVACESLRRGTDRQRDVARQLLRCCLRRLVDRETDRLADQLLILADPEDQ